MWMVMETKKSAKQERHEAEARALEDEVVEVATRTPEQEKTLEDIADLLDEIDAVLEPNAYEFVHNYVQAGGE